MGFRGEAFAFDSPAEAIAAMVARVRAGARGPRTEAGALETVLGRVLAEPIVTPRDSPPFDYSAMDGYAVRVADVAEAGASVTLTVVGESRIGTEPPAMPTRPGVVRIATGAGIPDGANAVVRREDVDEHEAAGQGGAPGAAVSSVSLSPKVISGLSPGDNIRRRGENARARAMVLNIGSVLTSAAIGTLASVGAASPRVYARPRVAIITTGDELVPPGATPGAYQIHDSNAPTIRAALSAHPWINVVSIARTRDESDRLIDALCAALAAADAIILTGGVSMGHRDPVRAALEQLGTQVVFHGLPQRPGKPMLGGISPRLGASIPVFALPGNPVSAMVTCVRIVLPVLASLAGITRWPPAPRVAIANPDSKSLELWWHRLVRVNAHGDAELVDGRGSGDIVAGGRSDGFIEVPPASIAGEKPTGLFPFYPWPA